MEHRRAGRGQLRLLRGAGGAPAPRARRPRDVAAQRRALAVLRDDPEGRYSWLCDPVTQIIRVGILAELGHIEDDAALRALAARICGLKPRTREAVAMIRHWRRNATAPAGETALTREILAAIDAYLARHPGTTRREIVDALHDAAVARSPG
jgi:hypothetical protein